MPKKPKRRDTLEDLLASCSETLFSVERGAARARLNSHGAEGDTALHVMLWRSDTSAALQSIMAGADVNGIGEMSETPLHVATRKQNHPVIKAMPEAGARDSCMSDFGQSPMDIPEEMGGDVRKLFSDR